jgi:pimeloyl-ACP methyl ester carboxylesterase
MATYVLIHGAGSDSWYWHRVAPLLEERGHDVVTMDLPCADESAGLAEYTDVVLRAVGDRAGLVVVGQSLGGFVAPLVAARRPVDLLVLLNGMVPRPGESDWWEATGHPVEIGPDFDPFEMFLHDVPEEVRAEAGEHAGPQAAKPMSEEEKKVMFGQTAAVVR